MQYRNTRKDIWKPNIELPSNAGEMWMKIFWEEMAKKQNQ